jgi:peptide/nickel transport system permease protein
VHGDLGTSLFYRLDVATLIKDRLGPTLWLLLFSAVMSVLIAVPLAVIAASRPDGARDQLIRFVPMFGLGMPAFWVGIILLILFALNFGRLFPVGGYGHGFTGHVHSMILPALTVALFISPILIRSLRASLLDVLQADYITTARAKGISERRVMVKHALRNGIISMVTVLGLNIAYLVGGTLVVEQVFALPGIGSLMITSIFQRDFTVVQAIALVFAILVVLINLLTDIVHSLLDPRVRFD